MKSKVERVQDAVENIEGAISYYLEDAKNLVRLNKISRGEYTRLAKTLNDLENILSSLKFAKPFSYKKLDDIRVINLSINSLYDEGDYDIIFAEIVRTNNELCRTVKERDRKLLNDFKKIFNRLTNFYKFRLSKAEINSAGDISFKDKGFDNVSCILTNYLNARYNFKKVCFQPVGIPEEYQHQIDDCARVIETDHYNDEVKSIYLNIGRLISRFAKAETIVSGLEQIVELCDRQEFLNIKVRAKAMIEKYKNIYQISKEKYDIVIAHLEAKTAQIAGTMMPNEIDEIQSSNVVLEENDVVNIETQTELDNTGKTI